MSFLYTLLSCITLFSAHPLDPIQSEVTDFFNQQTSFVLKKDIGAYLRSLDSDDDSYYYEQLRWFQDVLHVTDKDQFRQKVISIQKKDHGWVVHVENMYTIDQKRKRSKKILKLKRMGNRLVAEEFFPYKIENGNIKVYYSEKSHREKSLAALKSAEDTLHRFQERYRWQPKELIIKLYHLPEVFRASVKLSLPTWAAGWHEHKESIKLIGDLNQSFIENAVIHELTHQMVSDLTNDNASYWLQEGAAMTFEGILSSKEDKFVLPREERFSISDLGKKDLESLPDEEAWRYYLSSKLLFRFLLENYGEEKMEKLFVELSKLGENDADSRSKRSRNHQFTLNSIKKIYGLSLEDLDEKYQSYQ